LNNLLYWFLQNSFMKGQYLTVEYVIFFAIGIAMVIGIYLTFTNINTDLRQDAATMQLEKTNELIRDSIVNIYEAGNRTGADIITYELSIPPRLSGHTYVIKYDGNAPRRAKHAKWQRLPLSLQLFLSSQLLCG